MRLKRGQQNWFTGCGDRAFCYPEDFTGLDDLRKCLPLWNSLDTAWDIPHESAAAFFFLSIRRDSEERSAIRLALKNKYRRIFTAPDRLVYAVRHVGSYETEKHPDASSE